MIDCDPGHDDAIALLLALAQDDWTVDGITVVAGNQTLDKTVRNTLQTLTVAGRGDVPVFAGMDGPMVRELVTAEHVHGVSGLEGPVLPEPDCRERPEHAVDWLAAHLRAQHEPIDIIATGPLSNIGTLLRRAPDVVDKVRQIVLMGGAITEGNITPSAEFNIYVDPEAAHVVFTSGLPVTMVGLDVTHQAMLPVPRFEEIRALGGPVAEMVADLLHYFAGFHQRTYGVDGVPIHDACAVGVLLDPALVTTRRLRVDVETAGVHTAGRTVVDLWGVTGSEPNVDVCIGIDAERFLGMLMAALERYAV